MGRDLFYVYAGSICKLSNMPKTFLKSMINTADIFFVQFPTIVLMSLNFYLQPFLSQPISTSVPLLYSLKTRSLQMFSGGIEVKHWLKIGLETCRNNHEKNSLK